MKLIKFEQTNCTPCKMLGNFLKNELHVEMDETINISEGTIVDKDGNLLNPDDADKAMELAGEFGIMKTPTLILVDEDGTELDRFSGVGQNGVRGILTKRGLI